MVSIRNAEYGYLDKDTFKLVFDGGIDEDGDEFFYCCEYWIDDGSWHFQRIYDDDYTDAYFTEAEEWFVQETMTRLMKTNS